MGNLVSNESLTTNQELIQKLTFILEETSPSMGEITVLRLNQRPFDYFMRYRQSCLDTPTVLRTIQEKKKIYQALEGLRTIVKIEATQIRTALDLCSKTISFDSYARYHNYTLKQAIQSKLNSERKFTEGDLLYILGALLTIGEKITAVLGKNYRGLFKAQNIYLSTEGYLKVYPFQLMSINNTNQSYEETTQSVSSELQVQNYVHKSGQKGGQREDIRNLAVLLLQLATLSREEKNWHQHLPQLETRLYRQMCPQIRNLVITMLVSVNELTYSGLLAELQNIKQIQRLKASHCIRLEEDISVRSSEIMQQRSVEVVHERSIRLRRLQSIGNNLMASRIDLCSSRKRE